MSDVSVIGCGAMGSALIKTFAATNNSVTIWNRTREKAEALAGPGVTVSRAADDALAASPLVILSVADQGVAHSLLADTGTKLTGTAVASASFVTPDQGRKLADLVLAAGGHYLDLSIPAYPSQIGTGSAVLLLSGHRGSFDKHRPQLECLGTATFVGEDPGAAHIAEMALLLPYLPMAVSLFQGVRLAQERGLSMQWYEDTFLRLYDLHMRALFERIGRADDPSNPENVEASVRTWGDGAADYAAYLREAGLDAGMYDALHRLFQAGVAQGRGDHDWTYIADVTATER
jgi:3-hydroxyisobutyrate dehydrogenase-like beta-hydroxyacid dehydrogenase